MKDPAAGAESALERRYRFWLRCYPSAFRSEHEAEMLGVLMAGAREQQRWPDLTECLDLAFGALRVQLRPRVARSDRPRQAAVRMMLVGALFELATLVTVAVTADTIRTSLLRRDPGYTAAQWHQEVTVGLHPLMVGAGFSVCFWLVMAWVIGRGGRWRGPRIAFACFFIMTTVSLLNGLDHGSALYARFDLVAGSALWLVEFATLLVVFREDPRSEAARELGMPT
ncbi:MAG TPA: hypothetical protein VGM10_05805 [Actinocrinis sp.]|jgi:hypothetical protein